MHDIRAGESRMNSSSQNLLLTSVSYEEAHFLGAIMALPLWHATIVWEGWFYSLSGLVTIVCIYKSGYTYGTTGFKQ